MIAEFRARIVFWILFLLFIVFVNPYPSTPRPSIAVPCNGNSTGCVVHVFRIQLHENLNGSTKEATVEWAMKPKPKYGKNVYAPIGNKESHQLAEKIVAKMPDSINENVKERVRKEEFLIAPLDDEQPHNEEIGSTIESTQFTTTDAPTTSNRNLHVSQLEEAFPLFLLMLLVAIGVVVGVLCTCLALFLVDYRQKPVFDRSTAISYKRPSIVTQVLVDPDRRTIIERSSVTKTYSTRPPAAPNRQNRSRAPNRAQHRDLYENGMNIGGGESSRESSRHFIQNIRQH